MLDKVHEVIDMLPTSQPIYRITYHPESSWHQFSSEHLGQVELPKPNNFIEDLVYRHFREKRVGKVYEIDRETMMHHIVSDVVEFLKRLYIKYNNISQFRRTNFSKHLARARMNSRFIHDAFDLYAFCGKVGITRENAESHACLEYVASEFKSLGEKYGS